jgi:hypothetical protein
MRLSTTSQRRNRYVPQFDHLEARALMSATPAHLIPGQHLILGVTAGFLPLTNDLAIRGGDRADHILINDSGLNVSVYTIFPSGSFREVGTFRNVRTIFVNTNGGDDIVDYHVQATQTVLFGGPLNHAIRRTVQVSLGDGDDHFQALVAEPLLTPNIVAGVGNLGQYSSLGMKVYGGRGNDYMGFGAGLLGLSSGVALIGDGGTGDDTYDAFYGAFGQATQANAQTRFKFTGGGGNDTALISVFGSMTSGSTLSTDLEGGTGQDNFAVNYHLGSMNGSANVFLAGDDNADHLSVDFELDRFSSFGRISASLFGDAGDDDLTFIAHKKNPHSGTTVSANLTGGSGFDTAHFTSGPVTISQIESTNLVP